MYKKLLLIVLSIITIQAAKAQTEKGSQSLGLGFGVSTQSSNTSYYSNYTNSYGTNSKGKQTSYSITPSYSYFIADKLDIGTSLSYGGSNTKYDPALNSQTKQTSRGFDASIFLRKYFLYDNKIGIRTGPYLNYEKAKQTITYTESLNNINSDIDNYGGGLSLDFVYYPSKNIGLAAGLANLGYLHQKSTGYNQGSSNTFNLSLVNNLSLSVFYAFGK
ncbi:MAG: hypothetical protein JWR38_4955 [Mucilaginibacter sp.]|nr:hypothetical protein [Mucilaginibacter sp.]